MLLIGLRESERESENSVFLVYSLRYRIFGVGNLLEFFAERVFR